MAKSYSVELKLYRQKSFSFLQTLLFELAHLMLHACKKSGWVTEQSFQIKQMFCADCVILRGILTSAILRA